jgi:hypothetical protein
MTVEGRGEVAILGYIANYYYREVHFILQFATLKYISTLMCRYSREEKKCTNNQLFSYSNKWISIFLITIDNTDENCVHGCVVILSCKNKSRTSSIAALAFVKLTTRLHSLEHLLCDKKYFLKWYSKWHTKILFCRFP